MRLTRKNIYEINIWPGFVDILGTLLIVTIFTVLISTITQIFFNDQLEIKRGEISTLDQEIKKLLSQIELESELNEKLEKKNKSISRSFSEEKQKTEKLFLEKEEIEQLKKKSDYLLKMKSRELSQIVDEKSDLLDSLKSKNSEVKKLSKIEEQKSLEIFELKRDLDRLNKRLSELSRLLIEAEENDKSNKVKIKNLGQQLNQALAGKVAELSKYQSVFFKKIREALGDRQDVIVSGDRFIFPSEIFFESGSDIIQLEGLKKLEEIANSLIEISAKIPKKLIGS